MPSPTPTIIPTTDSFPDSDETESTPEPTEDPTVTTTSQPVDPNKDACKLTKFDTITVIEGDLHFFKDGWANQYIPCERSKTKKKNINIEKVNFDVLLDRNYWKMSSKSDAGPKGPFAISEKWPVLPAVIDSAFEDILTKKLYFFSGTNPSYIV